MINNFKFDEGKLRRKAKIAYFLSTPFVYCILIICSVVGVPVYILFDGKPNEGE